MRLLATLSVTTIVMLLNCITISFALAEPAQSKANEPAVKQSSKKQAKPTTTDPVCASAPMGSNGIHKPQVRVKSCLVSLSAVDKLRIKNNFQFVDVRLVAEYDHYHIANSINIPLYLVKTKSFLKELPIVLVNDGRSTAELERACVDLKQDGFASVSVLDGGLFAWYINKRPLEGDAVEQEKINRMSASELLAEHAFPDWVAMDVSTPGKFKDLRSWLPANVTVIALKAKPSLAARVEATIVSLRKSHPQGKLLLIADDDEAYKVIDSGLKKIRAAEVLRLDGGLKAYRAYISQQESLWKERNQQKGYAACRG